MLNGNVLKSIDDVITQFYYYRCFLVTPNLEEFLKMNVTKKGVKTVMTQSLVPEREMICMCLDNREVFEAHTRTSSTLKRGTWKKLNWGFSLL